MGTTILNWFSEQGEELGTCTAFATGGPDIAVPPGISLVSHQGDNLKNTWIYTFPKGISVI